MERSIIEPGQEEPSPQGGVERQKILELSTAVWAFSALAGACEGGILDVLSTPKTAAQIGEQVGASSALAGAILDVLAALDLVQVAGDTYVLSAGMSTYIGVLGKNILRGDLRATQLLTEDLAQRFRVGADSVAGWQYEDPAILQAWGMRSVEQVVWWTERLFRLLDGLPEALQTPQARFLDVGTGVGRLAIAMCRQFPNLRVVGLDPFQTAINLARQNVAEERLSDRIDLRCMPVQELTDTKSFDLAWVPVMFLNPPSVVDGFHRLRGALRPGGWLIVGTVAAEGEGIQPAVLKLMSVLFSGGLLQSKEAAEILEHAGFDGGKCSLRHRACLTAQSLAGARSNNSSSRAPAGERQRLRRSVRPIC